MYAIESFGRDKPTLFKQNKKNFMASSVILHHDAITGTHTDRVDRGYTKIMHDVLGRNVYPLSYALKKEARLDGLVLNGRFEHCHEQFTSYFTSQKKKENFSQETRTLCKEHGLHFTQYFSKAHLIDDSAYILAVSNPTPHSSNSFTLRSQSE